MSRHVPPNLSMASIPVPVPRPVQGSGSKSPELGVVQLSDLADTSPSKLLELAARFVDEYRARDNKYPQLKEFAGATSREFYSDPNIAAPASSQDFSPFVSQARPLPPDLVAGGSLSGLLPELGRVWVAAKKELYLWNYQTAVIQKFDEMANEITAVHVVPPKRDVFADIVRHILVISTTSTMHLYAVSYEDSDPTTFKIFDTGIAVNISGLGTPRICPGLSSGRIIFTGSKRGTSLFETRYIAKETWFRSRSSLVTHSGGSGFLGAQSDGEEQIIDIVGDESRGIVYTLSSKSTIRAYSAKGAEGDAHLMHSYSRRDISRWVTSSLRDDRVSGSSGSASANGDSNGRVPSGAATPRPGVPSSGSGSGSGSKDKEVPSSISGSDKVSIVAISAYTSEQSKQIPLVGITSKGIKVLFVAYDIRGTASLTSAIAREPPTGQTFTEAVTHGRYFDRDFGVAAAPQSKSGTTDLFLSSIDSTRVLQQLDSNQYTLAELSGWLSVDGTVKQISQISLPKRALSQNFAGPVGYGNDTALSYTKEATEAIVLTTKAVYFVRARNFYERLEVSNNFATQLAHTYSNLELCCAALAVATRPSSVLSKQLRESAISTFFRLGGLPVFKKDIETTRNNYIQDARLAIGASAKAQADSLVAVRLSSLFDGLATYTSRLLLDVWDHKLVSYKEVKGQPQVNTVKFNIDKTKLEFVYSALAGLTSFLDNNRSFLEGMSDRPQYSQHLYGQDISVLNSTEQSSLSAISSLVKSSQQGIGFLLLVLSETSGTSSGLATLLGYFSENNFNSFLKLSFRQFFSEAKHSDVARELVTCLVNYVINKGGSIDSLARVIQDRCDTYCSASDIMSYKAFQFLHAANSTNDGAEKESRTRNLYESVSMFKKAAKGIHIETLRDIVSSYQSLDFYSGIAEVVLAVAAESDPAGVAAGFLRDGKPEKDPREVVYKYKEELFSVLFKSLDSLSIDSPAGKETLRILLDSNDEVLHFHLYDWFLAKGHSNRISQVNSPFIQRYLQAGAKTSVQIAELLWKYFQRRDDLLAAADVLLDLGRGPLPVKFNQRIEYLSRAKNYCNSTFPAEMYPEVEKLSTMVSAYLEIATVQSDVLSSVEADDRQSPEIRAAAVKALTAKLLTNSELYNDFTSPLGYFALSLDIFNASDFRDPTEIRKTWEELFNKTRMDDELADTRHSTHISSIIQSLGSKFEGSPFVFPVDFLVPFTEKYALDFSLTGNPGWVVQAFLSAGVRHETLYRILKEMFVQRYAPFDIPETSHVLALDILYLLGDWVQRGNKWSLEQYLERRDLQLLGDLGDESEAAKYTQYAR